MSDKSTIEWTEATWNPVTGCSKVSPGCANCYAETLSLRYGYSKLPWTPANAAENVVLHPERLRQPLKWRRSRLIFVNSMSDLFHELVPFDYIDRVFEIMEHSPQHTFQVLTKRPERQREYMSYRVKRAAMGNQDLGPPFESVLPNVWLGTSIENDRWVTRADDLRATWAAIRFLSLEPLLGPLPSLDLTGIDWAIVGGESGSGHRPIQAEWIRDLRDRCNVAGVAFFFKQWGGHTPKAGGRILDGRTWDEMPQHLLVAA